MNTWRVAMRRVGTLFVPTRFGAAAVRVGAKGAPTLLLGACLVAAGAAQADTYQLTAGWTDPTVYQPSDAPTYELRYRVAGGAETVLPGLTNPAATATLTASPGDAIEVSARALNAGLESAWTAWVAAIAGWPPTQPGEQGGLSITVIRTGP